MASLIEAIEIKRKSYFEYEKAPYHCLDVEVSKPTARGGQTLAKEIAMHIAAASPLVVKREDLPGDTLEKEKEIYRAQFAGQNKPANVIEKIVEGKLESYYSQVCLMDQPSVRDPNVTIKQMVAAATAKTGENVTITRFVRFKLGEATEQ